MKRKRAAADAAAYTEGMVPMGVEANEAGEIETAGEAVAAAGADGGVGETGKRALPRKARIGIAANGLKGLVTAGCLTVAIAMGAGLCLGAQAPEAYAVSGYENHGSYHTEPIYGDVYHPAVTHTEDQGYYETVIIGYRCATCGATK